MEKGLKALGICLQSIIRLFGILWLSLLLVIFLAWHFAQFPKR